jgi:cell division protein FtsB
MRIVEQEEKPSVSFEDLLEVLQTKRENDTPPERARTLLSGFPIATTVLGIMMVAIGVMAMILKSDIATLKSDITDIKNLKAQIATLDPKIQLASIESKYEDMKKEKEVFKGEIAQLHTELETIKIERNQEKIKVPKRLRDRPSSTRNTVSDMKNVEVLLKKTSPQDGFSPDVSRALSLDPPRK